MTFKRAIQAAIFIVLQTLTAILWVSLVAPSWMIACGIVAAALATLLLILFAGDEKSAQLFFFENWAEIEEARSPNIGFIFLVVASIWILPLLCFLLALTVVGLSRSGWL